MEIIIDECISTSTRLILQEKGHKLLNVENILCAGVEDEEIFKYAAEHQLPIITHDRGFGVLYHFSQNKPATIIILSVISPHPKATNDLLKKFLSKFKLDKPEYHGKLIIVDSSKIRIRTKKD